MWIFFLPFFLIVWSNLAVFVNTIGKHGNNCVAVLSIPQILDYYIANKLSTLARTRLFSEFVVDYNWWNLGCEGFQLEKLCAYLLRKRSPALLTHVRFNYSKNTKQKINEEMCTTL